jgi:S1 RNA binding domain protein
MELVVGAIVDGKVTGIMKFGAFVALPNGKSGLVHISEISHTYVNEVGEHLREGQDVKVKIIGIDEAGRINLSIKKASEPPALDVLQKRRPSQQAQRHASPQYQRQPADPSFEDKLKQFMQESDSRISGNKFYSDRKSSRGAAAEEQLRLKGPCGPFFNKSVFPGSAPLFAAFSWAKKRRADRPARKGCGIKI